MDLGMFDVVTGANAGVEVVLRHPATGAELISEDGVPFAVTVLGEQSDVYQKALKASVNRRLADQNKKRKGNATMTVEEIEADEIALLAAAVKSWRGIKLDGQSLEFSQENVRKVLQDKRFPWIRAQLMEAVRDEGNFIKS